MADISITTTSGITFTFAEGQIKTINSKIEANIEPQAIPTVGPSGAYLFDYNGPVKTINLTGDLFATGTSRVTGYSIDTVIEQKQWLESLINGNQQPLTFTSNYETLSVLSQASATPPYQSSFTYTKVFIQSLSFNEQEANVEALPFSMTLIVGTG